LSWAQESELEAHSFQKINPAREKDQYRMGALFVDSGGGSSPESMGWIK